MSESNRKRGADDMTNASSRKKRKPSGKPTPHPAEQHDYNNPNVTKLLDLPIEIFEDITCRLVHSISVVEAFRIRRVCKAFRDLVEHEVLSEIPEKDIIDRRLAKDGARLLKHNMSAYLEYRMRKLKGARPLLPDFANRVVKDLMKVTQTTSAWDRKVYAACISRAITENYGDAWAAIGGRPCTVAFVRASAELRTRNVKDYPDRFCAAAAIGHIGAMKMFLGDNQYHPSTQSKFFGKPLATAASQGHLIAVKALARLEIDMSLKAHPGNMARIELDQKTWGLAITASFKGKHYDVASFLLRVYSNYHRFAFKTQYEEWLIAVVRKGDIELVEDVLRIIPDDSGVYTYGLQIVCEEKQWAIARLFFDRNFIDVNQEFEVRIPNATRTFDCPLSLAAAHGGRDLVSRLLKLGARRDGTMGLIFKPHWAAISNGHEDLALLLERHGADTTYDWDVVEAYYGTEKHPFHVNRLVNTYIIETNPVYGTVDIEALFVGTPTLMKEEYLEPLTLE
jgi:hypothetical protein